MSSLVLAFALLCGVAGPDREGGPTGRENRVVVLQTTSDDWLGPDKLRHFMTSFAAVGYASAGLRILDADADAATGGAIAITLIAGLGKEIYDLRTHGHFSLKDLVWDLLGAGVGAVLIRAAR